MHGTFSIGILFPLHLKKTHNTKAWVNLFKLKPIRNELFTSVKLIKYVFKKFIADYNCAIFQNSIVQSYK